MLILAAILAIFVYGMIAAMLGTILPDLAARLHLTPSQNGKIAFGQALGLMIASLGVGPLMDNQGKKTGLIVGLALVSSALFALPKSRGFGNIAALFFVLGVGGGIIVTGANALASDVSEAHRATTLNLVNLFFGLGGLATPFFVGQSALAKFCAAVLHGRDADSHHAADPPGDAYAWAERVAKLRVRRGRFGAREAYPLHVRVVPLLVCCL